VELDRLQSSYKAAVEEWIAAIRKEEALASVDHSEAELDAWEAAGQIDCLEHVHEYERGAEAGGCAEALWEV
jgi:hypothetical protein